MRQPGKMPVWVALALSAGLFGCRSLGWPRRDREGTKPPIAAERPGHPSRWRPQVWGHGPNGLALGMRETRGTQAIAFDLCLTNGGQRPIYLPGNALAEPPRFEFLSTNCLAHRLVARPATLGPAGPPERLPGGTPCTGMLEPGGRLDLGTFVVGPRWEIETLDYPRSWAKVRVRFTCDAATAARGKFQEVELVAGPVAAPESEEERDEAERRFMCCVMKFFEEQTDLPRDQVLIAIARDKTQKCLVRGIATMTLARFRSSEGARAMMEMIRDPSEPHRATLVLHLGLSGYKPAIPMMEELCRDSDDPVRAHAAGGLGLLGASDAVPLLVELLEKDTFHSARENAARSLGYLRGDEALHALHKALMAEPHHNVRYNIILAIERFRDRRSVPVLLEILRSPGPRQSSLFSDAARAIDSITDRTFKGDIPKIEQWLRSN